MFPSERICFFPAGDSPSPWRSAKTSGLPSPPAPSPPWPVPQVILNPSASNELVGKADYRRDLIRQQSARLLGAYAYASAGPGESTTDTVFGGHSLICENGTLLGENERFSRKGDLLFADVDLEFLNHERHNSSSFRESLAGSGKAFRTVEVVRPLWKREKAERPPAPAPLCSEQSGQKGRTVPGNFRHPGGKPGHPAEPYRLPGRGARPLRRPGLHPGPSGRGGSLRLSGMGPLGNSLLHHARLRHHRPH